MPTCSTPSSRDGRRRATLTWKTTSPASTTTSLTLRLSVSSLTWTAPEACLSRPPRSAWPVMGQTHSLRLGRTTSRSCSSISLVTSAPSSGSVLPFDSAARAAFKAIQDRLSRNAERVIVLCEKTGNPKEVPGTNAFSDEIALTATEDLVVVGILGIIDPPRPETAATVSACRRGGARFFMVTGDYGLTAAAIARNIGIFTHSAEPDNLERMRARSQVPSASASSGGKPTQKESKGADVFVDQGTSLLLEGSSIAHLTQPDWDAVCAYEEIVFVRTTPEQKLRIVTELRERRNVVAVTGDGVNDAPALRAADVGVAVISGSDVAIDAADLVLMDRFDSIVDAIRLGRLVFQNLQKVIAYLLPAGSWSEIWPVLLTSSSVCPCP